MRFTDIRIVRDFPHPPAALWRILTEPALVPLWTAEGKGGRLEGFAPIVGNRFRYVAKPMPGWNGIVECEIVAIEEPKLLRYTWRGADDDDVTTVTNLLEPHGTGTRFTWEHTGFTGMGGYVVSRILKRVRTRMLEDGFPIALAALGGP